MNVLKSIGFILACLLVIGGGYVALNPQVLAQQSPSRPIETATWEQLMKPGAMDFFFDRENWDYLDSLSDEEYNALFFAAEAATNPLMDGKRVRIPGFMVSLDLDTSRVVKEFIFVPYQGACIHTPPPPPSQTILVKAPDGTKVWDNWEPVEVTGVLTIESSQLDIADAGYTLAMETIAPFDYDRTDPDYAMEQAQGAHGG